MCIIVTSPPRSLHDFDQEMNSLTTICHAESSCFKSSTGAQNPAQTCSRWTMDLGRIAWKVVEGRVGAYTSSENSTLTRPCKLLQYSLTMCGRISGFGTPRMCEAQDLNRDSGLHMLLLATYKPHPSKRTCWSWSSTFAVSPLCIHLPLPGVWFVRLILYRLRLPLPSNRAQPKLRHGVMEAGFLELIESISARYRIAEGAILIVGHRRNCRIPPTHCLVTPPSSMPRTPTRQFSKMSSELTSILHAKRWKM